MQDEAERKLSVDSGSSSSIEDAEPVFSYFRMKTVVNKILNDDFASCMCVNSKVNIFFKKDLIKKLTSPFFSLKAFDVRYALGPHSHIRPSRKSD